MCILYDITQHETLKYINLIMAAAETAAAAMCRFAFCGQEPQKQKKKVEENFVVYLVAHLLDTH